MKRGIHELSDYEKQDIADDLMLPTGVFGAALVAGLLCLGLIWQPHALFDRAAAPRAASVALRGTSPLTVAKTLRIQAQQPGRHAIAAE